MKTDKSTRPPTAHIAPFGLRMQPELRAKLEAAATASGRSMNAELVARLEASFSEPSNTEEQSFALSDALETLKVYAEERGVTPEEALSAAANAALTGAPIAYVIVDVNMRLADIRAATEEARKVFGEYPLTLIGLRRKQDVG